MRAPIKERIVVLRYARMDDEVYRNVCDALFPYLESSFEQDPFVKERLNTPSVTMPLPTIGEQEPDWAQVRVAIDQTYRFWNGSRTRCIQFFKDYLTVNLIEAKSVCKAAGSHEELFDFFLKVLPFISQHAKAFKMTGAGLDYLNVLSEDQLFQYLTNDGKTLELAHLFRSDMIGRAIPGAMSLTPLVHQTVYGPDPLATAPFPARLTVSVRVPDRGPDGWRVEVLLSAAGPLQTFSPNTVREFLASMHCAVYQGYCATFSDEIVNQGKKVSP